ncbi:unnamed protein product [Symbiodinium natans]|uniref:Uncharacterized protein n=1 Tax=Symbiodinium natans TaxID=878477 RepID=A0A812UZZ9_9DINO|nr:unnamed protein product [Symbiodinium natans]
MARRLTDAFLRRVQGCGRYMYELLRVPQSSAAGRHRARLGTLLVTIIVIPLQNLFQIGVHFSPSLVILQAILLPAALVISWRLRHRLDDDFPHFWDDARASNLLQMAIFYGIVVFHLIPLLIWGSGQDVAESLTLNVAGYFGIYFIVLDNHTLPTVLISLYAVAACIKAAVTQASFTKGMMQQSFQTFVYSFFTRYFLLRLDRHSLLMKILEDTRWRRESSSQPRFEALIDLVRHREGHKSLAKVLSVYRLRQDRKEGLVAQFIWMYHAMTTWNLPQNVCQQIFGFLDPSEPTIPGPTPSTASGAAVSSLDATAAQSLQSTLTSVSFLRRRLVGSLLGGDCGLREMRKQGKHVNEGCDKESLRELMRWDKVTRREGSGDNEPCKVTPDCPCNEEVNCGEVLQIMPNAVQLCLREFGPEGDRELFEELSGSASAVEEGSVWKAGGKLIFSAFDRNQSVQALTRMLNNAGRSRCVRMLMQMVKYSEAEYGGYVTAIQINFHLSGESFHAQHRDIYSAKQRAGPSCTCTFKKCVGTVCYTVGSSRQCLLETMTDTFSSVKPCGADCTGRRERRWLHSGDAMYFNEAWNAGSPSL